MFLYVAHTQNGGRPHWALARRLLLAAMAAGGFAYILSQLGPAVS
jgi:hypothetical protein